MKPFSECCRHIPTAPPLPLPSSTCSAMFTAYIYLCRAATALPSWRSHHVATVRLDLLCFHFLRLTCSTAVCLIAVTRPALPSAVLPLSTIRLVIACPLLPHHVARQPAVAIFFLTDVIQYSRQTEFIPHIVEWLTIYGNKIFMNPVD